MSSTLKKTSLILRLRVLKYEHNDYNAKIKRDTLKIENVKFRDSKSFNAIS